MPGYGRQVLGTIGQAIMVLFNLVGTIWKGGGITVDWTTVAAVGADTTLPDGTIVPNGQKFLRFGQIMCLIGASEVQTVTGTGGPTGGAFTITTPAFSGNAAATTTPLSVTSTAAQVEAALTALPSIGPGGASVARAGAGTAGSPYVWTITYARRLGNVPQVTIAITTALTGGTTPSIDPATTTAGAGTGLYGPYDSTATDGRQTLSRGDCYILNETVLQYPPLGWGRPASDYPAVFDGGTVWKARLLVTSGTASLAEGPTFTAFEAAFPRIGYAPEP